MLRMVWSFTSDMPPWNECRGHSFLSTNEELLDRYATCPTSVEVIQVQNQYLEQLANVPAKVPDGKACLAWLCQ